MSVETTPNKCVFIDKQRPVGDKVRCTYLGCTLLANTTSPEAIRTVVQEQQALNVCEAGSAKPDSDETKKVLSPCILKDKDRERGAAVRCSTKGCLVLVNSVDPEDIKVLQQGPPDFNICIKEPQPSVYIQDPLPFSF